VNCVSEINGGAEDINICTPFGLTNVTWNFLFHSLMNARNLEEEMKSVSQRGKK
jgi:hypothetical protein